MTGSRWRAELAALTLRPAVGVGLAGIFVLCVADAWQNQGRPPLGVVGTIALNTDGTLTYGLGGTALLACWVVSGHRELAEIWHTRGLGLHQRLVRSLLFAAPIAIAGRLVALAGIVVGGALDGLNRGWRWGSLVPVSAEQLLRAQFRLLLAYLLVAALGALVALVAGRAVAIALLLVATVPYIPFAGALANRAGPLLDLLPWGPFGALRGTVTGNGAIFGADPAHGRLVETAPAAFALVAWFAVLVGWLLFSPMLTGDRVGLWYAVPVPAAIALVCIAALTLPGAMAGHVPWRWTPDWRHAKAHGDDSRQVARTWALRMRERNEGARALFADPDEPPALSPGMQEVLESSATVSAQAESSMTSPDYVRLDLTFDPVRRSGNVLIDRAQLQVRLRKMGDGWRILRVEGPFVHVQVTR